MTCLRIFLRRGDSVVTSIPSSAGVWHEAIGFSAPLTSTTQIRQAPVGETFLR